MKTYKCLNCGVTNKWGYSKVNKFCNNTCQGKYKWEHQTKPRVLEGKVREPTTLKKFLVEKFGEVCKICGLGATYNNLPLTLQVDHIDGNSDNNMPKNLRLLCPNCHSQTDTHGCKGQGNRYKKVTKRNKYLQEYKTHP